MKKYRSVEWILVDELKSSYSVTIWLILNSRKKKGNGTTQGEKSEKYVDGKNDQNLVTN